MAQSLRDVLPRIDTISFDCYGTLVDWETGIEGWFVELAGDIATDRAVQLFETYVEAEAAIEGKGYRPYSEVIAEALQAAAQQTGVQLPEDTGAHVLEHVASWMPYPDTNDALTKLKARSRLGVLSNIDKALFARTAQHFPIEFDFVVTADDVHAYKPAHLHFHRLISAHAQRESVLHVAQSLFHDGVPCQQLGLPFVWINRRGERNETNVTPVAEFPDLASFAEALPQPKE